MDEFINDDEFISETYSISEPTLTDALAQPNFDLKIEEKVTDYPLRCSSCWTIPRLYFNLNANNYSLICNEGHKNIFMSFPDLIEDADKKLSSLLCHQCKKESDKMFRCNDNNLFFCSECKNNVDSNNFTEIQKIDTECPKHHKKYKYYDTKVYKNICDECLKEIKENYLENKNFFEIEKNVNYKDTIDKYHKKAIENIKMWNNTSRIINDWLKKLNDKFHEFLSSIENYCLLRLKIVSYLKNENKYLNYINNYNIYSNYEAINNENADSFIRKINEYLSVKYNKNYNLSTMSTFLIKILDEYNKNEIKIESKINNNIQNIEKENSEKKHNNKEIKLIASMDKKHFQVDSKINCLIPFNQENYLLLGMKKGEISVCEAKGNDFKEKINIKEFDQEITHLCEIDKNLFIASDINNKIKIIQIKNNFSEYEIIKTLTFEQYNKINKIISLPIISYFQNRHYFSIAIDQYLFIYRSNKMPQYLEPPYKYYHNNIEEFSIVQPYEMQNNEKFNFTLEKKSKYKNIVENILEISDKYLAVICTDSKDLTLLYTQNNFKEETNLPNAIPKNKCGMKVSNTKTELVIWYDGGINIINITNLKNEKKVRNITFKQNIKFFDFFDKNSFMCLSLVNNEIYIKQYKFKNEFKECKKISEAIVLSENQVTNFFIIKDKIYYIDESNLIHYYE